MLGSFRASVAGQSGRKIRRLRKKIRLLNKFDFFKTFELMKILLFSRCLVFLWVALLFILSFWSHVAEQSASWQHCFVRSGSDLIFIQVRFRSSLNTCQHIKTISAACRFIIFFEIIKYEIIECEFLLVLETEQPCHILITRKRRSRGLPLFVWSIFHFFSLHFNM